MFGGYYNIVGVILLVYMQFLLPLAVCNGC